MKEWVPALVFLAGLALALVFSGILLVNIIIAYSFLMTEGLNAVYVRIAIILENLMIVSILIILLLVATCVYFFLLGRNGRRYNKFLRWGERNIKWLMPLVLAILIILSAMVLIWVDELIDEISQVSSGVQTGVARVIDSNAPIVIIISLGSAFLTILLPVVIGYLRLISFSKNRRIAKLEARRSMLEQKRKKYKEGCRRERRLYWKQVDAFMRIRFLQAAQTARKYRSMLSADFTAWPDIVVPNFDTHGKKIPNSMKNSKRRLTHAERKFFIERSVLTSLKRTPLKRGRTMQSVRAERIEAEALYKRCLVNVAVSINDKKAMEKYNELRKDYKETLKNQIKAKKIALKIDKNPKYKEKIEAKELEKQRKKLRTQDKKAARIRAQSEKAQKRDTAKEGSGISASRKEEKQTVSPPDVEKAQYNIFLKDAGANKINVIKVIKEITGLGLGESKALVDGAPMIIKEEVPAAEARVIEAKLREAGAMVELK